MGNRIVFLTFFYLAVLGFLTSAHADNNTISIMTPQAANGENEVYEKISTENPLWLKSYVTVLNHGKSMSGIKDVNIFNLDVQALTRLFNDEKNTPVMKLMALVALATNWDQFNQIYPSDANRLTFEKWRAAFVTSWEKISRDGEYTEQTEDCGKMWETFSGLEKALNADYAQTPEGKLEAEKNAVHPAFELWGDPARLRGKTVRGNFQVLEKVNQESYIVTMQDPDYNLHYFYLQKSEDNASEDFNFVDQQFITVTATVGGPYSYETVTGANSTVTKLLAVDVQSAR